MGEHRDIQLVVMEGRKCNVPLLRWIRAFPTRQIATPSSGLRDYLCLWRNQVIEQYLADRNAPPWLMMLDDDMVPVEDSEELVRCEADVSGALYWSRCGHGTAHGPDGTVGAGAIKISRRALLAIRPPWFVFETDPRGTKILQCECRYFCNKARAAGFVPVVAGRMAHILPMAVLVERDGKGFSIRFESEISRQP